MLLVAFAWSWQAQAGGQLEILTTAQPLSVFSGNSRIISMVFSNSSGNDFVGEIRVRNFQATSAIAALVSDALLKKIEVPANETVLETAALDFPQMKAKAKFLVQWQEDTNRIIGISEVLVYPTNLLQALRMADKSDFGVFDPNNLLKPLLSAQGIKFIDLGEMNLTNFTGKLAVIGPFESKAQEPDNLAKSILAIARNNVAVVWMQPPAKENDKLQPSFYPVRKRETAVIVAQDDLVADLAENPQSQLNLVSLCHLAMDPPPAALPDLESQP